MLLLGLAAVGLAAAAYGTWAFGHPGRGPLPLAPWPAALLGVLGGFVVMTVPPVASAIGGAGRRFGPLAFAAGVPDLAIAWTYVAALVAPSLIDADSRLLAALLGAEILAAYSTIMLVSLAETALNRPLRPPARLAMAGVLVLTLGFAAWLTAWAGSWVPLGSYVALVAKRVGLGLVEPGRTPASLTEHQIMRCVLPLVVLFFIGVPLFLYSRSLQSLLLLGALSFSFMAMLEMTLHARGRL